MPFVNADQAEVAFQRYLELHVNYDAAIRAAGDVPWHEDHERRAKVAARLGLSVDADPVDVRRALFLRGRRAA
jgi:hypothetical protein